MVTHSFQLKHVPDLIHKEREERISIVKLAIKSYINLHVRHPQGRKEAIIELLSLYHTCLAVYKIVKPKLDILFKGIYLIRFSPANFIGALFLKTGHWPQW